jgi:3-hydroxybutyrate dehydrogenase
LEVAGSGITVNCVNPGWVRTPLVEQQIEAKAAASGVTVEEAARCLLSEKQPSGQFVTCEQIGESVAFLCSPAADQINGISLPVDGGWTSQ